MVRSINSPLQAAVSALCRPGTPAWRLWQMALGWGCVGFVYTFAGCFSPLLGRSVVLLPASALDRLIPFLPVAVWWYLSFFLFIPWAYLAAPTARVTWLRRAMQLCALVCGAVFMAWPTVMPLQPAAHGGVSAQLLAWVRLADTSHNSLPSLHGALTVLTMLALIDTGSARRSVLAIVWAGFIAASVVLVRQHILIDLLTGMAVGATAGLVVARRHYLLLLLRRPT